MNEHDNKDELIQLIEDSDLDSTSEAYLKHKLDLNRITEKEKLEKEISIEKRKTELRKIVEKEDLDYTPKSIISYKIQQNFILSEYELMKELAVEKRKTEPVDETVTKRKRELIKIVEKTKLNSTSKSELTSKIIKQEIMTENELNKHIQNEEGKNNTDNSNDSYKEPVNEDENKSNYYDEYLGDEMEVEAILHMEEELEKEFYNQRMGN